METKAITTGPYSGFSVERAITTRLLLGPATACELAIAIFRINLETNGDRHIGIISLVADKAEQLVNRGIIERIPCPITKYRSRH